MMADKVSLIIFCILIFIFGSFAKPKDPQCKFPPQWQSTVFLDFGMFMSGVSGHAYGSGTFYYDYPNRRMRIDIKGVEENPDKQNFTVSFMWHFNEGATYYIDYDGKFCERSYQIDAVWNQWEGIPLASYPTYFGGIGGFKKIVGQFVLDIKDDPPTDNGIRVVMDVQVGDWCPPLRVMFQDLHDDPYEGVMYQYEFMDHTNLKNPDVFKAPSNCTNTTSMNEETRKFLPFQHLDFVMD
ncbi:uncharacterized protein LOC110451939 [Mizuhopecten yessoensis]|uniref:Mammalian ependymin-related protein 1 n=1 Tax=Mizuhopecten yessoensis TaxID=6573 RepID=A0A210QKR5_MIZYE|nr:uncharacterized protein LOC110451939 [Mizuhopecten yessoensis]OWF49343.1 hypothetical protein KP79_PYT14692 [Mizuhopecten yessoensis]